MSHRYDDDAERFDLPERNTRGEIVLLCLVLTSFLVTSIFLSTTTGYLFVTGVFGVSLLWLVLIGGTKFTVPRPALWLYLTIIALFIAGTLGNPSIQAVIRLVAFISVTSVLLFSLVYTVDFEIFWRLYSIATATIVLIGTPTLFVDQFSLGPLVITAYGTTPTAPVNIGLNTISSIFTNPNNLALVCCFAVVGLVTTQQLSRSSVLLVVVNAGGLFVSDGQAAQLAMIAGIGIFVVGRLNRSVVSLVTTVALGIITTGLLISFQLFPGPESLSTVSLSGRRHLWQASIQAFEIRPWIGYGTVNMAAVLEPYITNPHRLGVGPHNSYIRIALSSGILGFAAYLVLHLYTLFQSARHLNRNSLASHAVLWSAIIIQIFNGTTIFGISSSSILFATALGWALRDQPED